MRERRETITPEGKKLVIDEEILFPVTKEAALDEAINAVERATSRRVYAVYVNSDQDDPGRIHDLKFVLHKDDP